MEKLKLILESKVVKNVFLTPYEIYNINSDGKIINKIF
jgi:hypothetical protein